MRPGTEGRSILDVTLAEGRNRIVRRWAEEMGLRVDRLARLSYGPVRLGDLAGRPLPAAHAAGGVGALQGGPHDRSPRSETASPPASGVGAGEATPARRVATARAIFPIPCIPGALERERAEADRHASGDAAGPADPQRSVPPDRRAGRHGRAAARRAAHRRARPARGSARAGEDAGRAHPVRDHPRVVLPDPVHARPPARPT